MIRRKINDVPVVGIMLTVIFCVVVSLISLTISIKTINKANILKEENTALLGIQEQMTNILIDMNKELKNHKIDIEANYFIIKRLHNLPE